MTPWLIGHGIGQVTDLPVPAYVFYSGAGFVLVISFVLLGSLWRQPVLTEHAGGSPVRPGIERVVLARWTRRGLQTLSVFLFLVVFAAAAVGDPSSSLNLAPTWIYVVFWLGLPLLSAILGNVWRVLSPWLALADAFVWVLTRIGRPARPLARYPEQLGRWPGAAALFAFVALELAYADPSSPRALAVATAIYTVVCFAGYAAFGRDTWQQRGEGFAIAFAYFARMAPFAVIDGRLRVRWPFAGLAGTEPVPGSLAVIAVMLGSVAFDGFSRTSFWQDLLFDIQLRSIPENVERAERLATLTNLGGLTGTVLAVALAYLGACALMRALVTAPRSLTPDFLLSLIPIAFVYALAHYFSLFVVQGQYVISLMSDPLGRGWDLFGTATYEPELAPFSPQTIWYVQAASLVAGHIAGLVVAHDRAVTVFHDPDDAVRSQYAMLALMVAYTVGGLWLLSRG